MSFCWHEARRILALFNYLLFLLIRVALIASTHDQLPLFITSLQEFLSEARTLLGHRPHLSAH